MKQNQYILIAISLLVGLVIGCVYGANYGLPLRDSGLKSDARMSENICERHFGAGWSLKDVIIVGGNYHALCSKAGEKDRTFNIEF